MTTYRNRTFAFLAASCLILMGVLAASAAITMQTVPVGNPGNSADPATGYGSVGYAYSIGEYDVTANQYTAFLNAVALSDPNGLYNSTMAGTATGNPGIVQTGSSGSYAYSVIDGRGNYPVTDVTFWDATRFANWLDNGQPAGPEGAGTTETGSYTLTSNGTYYNTINRNTAAIWAVTSENEWYKAAYYSPTLNAGAGGYWPYPIQSNSISLTQANYDYTLADSTPVGLYPYPSYYGTYDQGGDVFQWNETIVSGIMREMRGGGFYNDDPTILGSGASTSGLPNAYYNDIGFRVSLVPEPTSLQLVALGLGGMFLMRRSLYFL